jgi:hypothetical protein
MDGRELVLDAWTFHSWADLRVSQKQYRDREEPEAELSQCATRTERNVAGLCMVLCTSLVILLISFCGIAKRSELTFAVMEELEHQLERELNRAWPSELIKWIEGAAAKVSTRETLRQHLA